MTDYANNVLFKIAQINGGLNAEINQVVNGNLDFKTNNTSRLTISSGGDVQAKGTNLGVTQSDGDYLAKLYQSSADGFLSLYTGESTPVERVRLSSYSDSWIVPALATGKVGIGRTNPSSKLHLDGSNYNTASETQFTITDHGNNYNSGDTSCRIVMESRYWSGDDNVSTRSAITNIKDNGNGSSGSAMAFHTTSQGAGAYSEKLRISSGGNVFVTSGNLIAGATSDVTGTHYFQKAVSVNGGILYAGSNTTGRFSLVVQASDSGYNNSPATCLKVGATSSTSRSVSAAGTFNASGADYAEYMIKSTTDPINKGDILGVNSDGLLTNIFNDAISFVIKSTDPSFVGNDTWGIESEDKDEIEEARIKVDRVAFSGQVPCNVTGASVGDYIIPVASSDGKITGEAVTNPTFEQYKISVGKVWKIMENGNSWVAVKIG
jgi:hypothetical protein